MGSRLYARAVLLLALVASPYFAFGQNTVTLTPSVTAGDGTLVTNISWSTTPALTVGTPCLAGGDGVGWNGAKAGSGTVGPLTFTADTHLILSCTFPGDSIATFSWTPAPLNTNGTPYTNGKDVVVRYTFNATVSTGPTPVAGETEVTSPVPNTMKTVTGITQTGTLRAVGFSRNVNNSMSVASTPPAVKVFTGNVVVNQAVDLTVRSVPNGPGAFSIN